MIREAFMVTPARSVRRPARRGLRFDMTVVRVDPRVWEVALELCEGRPRRIDVLSATEVVVRNQERR